MRISSYCVNSLHAEICRNLWTFSSYCFLSNDSQFINLRSLFILGKYEKKIIQREKLHIKSSGRNLFQLKETSIGNAPTLLILPWKSSSTISWKGSTLQLKEHISVCGLILKWTFYFAWLKKNENNKEIVIDCDQSAFPLPLSDTKSE